MGGSGHAMDMNNRLRQMRDERKSKGVEKFKRQYKNVAKRRKIDLYKATPRELRVIRKKVEALEKQRKLKLILISLICIVIILSSWHYLKNITLPIDPRY